eukprot:127489_1
MSIYRFVTNKKLIGSNAIHKSSSIAYFNSFSRQFCVVKESLNSPENSDSDNTRNDPFESLAQKSLLNEDNIPTYHELLNEHRERRYQERLTRKTQKSSEYGGYPEIFRQINNAATGSEIKQIVLDEMKDHDSYYHLQAIERLAQFTEEEEEDADLKTQSKAPRKPAIFTHAIRACFTLKQHKYGWELYELARERNCISNDLYSLVLFGKMHETPTNQSLQACFDLFDEWREEEKQGGLHITAKIYASLIAQCLKTRNFGKAFHVYNHLMLGDLDEETLIKVLQSSSVRQEISNLFVKSQGVEAAIKFTSDCKMKHGVLPNQHILCTLITGCGHEIYKEPGLLEVAEKLFAAAFDVLENDEEKLGTRIFSSLLVVYSKIGDYKSCIDLLNRMCDDEQWPDPDKYCIAPSLKAITIHSLKMENEGEEDKILTTKQKWELIDRVLEIQQKNDLAHDVITYSILINLCDGDRAKMTQLYRDMVEKDKIIPNRMALQNILLGGLDGFYEEIKLAKEDNDGDKDKEITEFIDWILSEMNKYNLSVSENFRLKLAGKLDKIKSLQ